MAVIRVACRAVEMVEMTWLRSNPQPWHPLTWMGAMWIGLIGLVAAATISLLAVVAVVAACAMFAAWRVRHDAILRGTDLSP